MAALLNPACCSPSHSSSQHQERSNSSCYVATPLHRSPLSSPSPAGNGRPVHCYCCLPATTRCSPAEDSSDGGSHSSLDSLGGPSAEPSARHSGLRLYSPGAAACRSADRRRSRPSPSIRHQAPARTRAWSSGRC